MIRHNPIIKIAHLAIAALFNNWVSVAIKISPPPMKLHKILITHFWLKKLNLFFSWDCILIQIYLKNILQSDSRFL